MQPQGQVVPTGLGSPISQSAFIQGWVQGYKAGAEDNGGEASDADAAAAAQGRV